jgi:CheY-like chemotaxis protein
MKTIMVVDDDANVRRSVRYILRSHGFRVVEAPGGEAAMTLLRDTPVDLVILDLVMPQMDGTEVCDQIKSDPAFCRIPVVIFTVVRGDVCRDWTRYVNANAFLVKPFEIKELLATVTGLLAPCVGNGAPSPA